VVAQTGVQLPVDRAIHIRLGRIQRRGGVPLLRCDLRRGRSTRQSDARHLTAPTGIQRAGVNAKCEVRTTLNHYPAAVDVDTYASDKPGTITCQKSHNFGYVGAGAVPA